MNKNVSWMNDMWMMREAAWTFVLREINGGWMRNEMVRDDCGLKLLIQCDEDIRLSICMKGR